MQILITQSHDEGIQKSLIVNIDNINDLVSQINDDKLFLTSIGGYKTSLKQEICMIVYYNDMVDEKDYVNYSVSKNQVREAIFQSFIDCDSAEDLRFWSFGEENLEPLDIYQDEVQEEFETTSFCWAKNEEQMIKSDDFQITNRDTGLPSSTFYLSKGKYKIYISQEELAFYHVDIFSGTMKLSGTEDENKFLEEIEDYHQRLYTLSNEKLNIFISKDYLVEKGLLDKEVFIYLIKVS